jgi:hypothetical protein
MLTDAESVFVEVGHPRNGHSPTVVTGRHERDPMGKGEQGSLATGRRLRDDLDLADLAGIEKLYGQPRNE